MNQMETKMDHEWKLGSYSKFIGSRGSRKISGTFLGVPMIRIERDPHFGNLPYTGFIIRYPILAMERSSGPTAVQFLAKWETQNRCATGALSGSKRRELRSKLCRHDHASQALST